MKVFVPIKISDTGTCNNVKWSGKLDKESGLPKGQGLLSRGQDAAKDEANGSTLQMWVWFP